MSQDVLLSISLERNCCGNIGSIHSSSSVLEEGKLPTYQCRRLHNHSARAKTHTTYGVKWLQALPFEVQSNLWMHNNGAKAQLYWKCEQLPSHILYWWKPLVRIPCSYFRSSTVSSLMHPLISLSRQISIFLLAWTNSCWFVFCFF